MRSTWRGKRATEACADLPSRLHMDVSSAASAYYARKVVPEVEAFGRFVLNLSSGGLNPAAVMQFVSMKGGWGRIVEMPTRDARPPQEENRPWVMPWLSLFPNKENSVPIVRNGELTAEAKGIIELVSNIRTVDSDGTVVITTGHATPEGHVLIVRESRRLGVPTLVTHPNDMVSHAQYQEMKQLGAYIEVNLDFYQEGDNADAKLAFALRQIERLGAESNHHGDRLRSDEQSDASRLHRARRESAEGAWHNRAPARHDDKGKPCSAAWAAIAGFGGVHRAIGGVWSVSKWSRAGYN